MIVLWITIEWDTSVHLPDFSGLHLHSSTLPRRPSWGQSLQPPIFAKGERVIDTGQWRRGEEKGTMGLGWGDTKAMKGWGDDNVYPVRMVDLSIRYFDSMHCRDQVSLPLTCRIKTVIAAWVFRSIEMHKFVCDLDVYGRPEPPIIFLCWRLEVEQLAGIPIISLRFERRHFPHWWRLPFHFHIWTNTVRRYLNEW